MSTDTFNAAAMPEFNIGDLLSAIERKDNAMTEAILASGQVSIEAAGKEGWTPLYRAIATGEPAFVKQVLAAGAKAETKPSYVDHESYTPLTFAIAYYRSSPAIVGLLLEAGAQIGSASDAEHGKSPLELAVKHNEESVVEMLLERGADPNQPLWYGETVVHLAAQEGHGEIIRILKSHGADLDHVSDFMFSPLSKAMTHRHREAFEVLIELGASIEHRFENPDHDNKSTLLMSAAIHGETGVIDFLAGKGYDVNYQNKEGKTALWYAANAGRGASVRRLLDLGADPNLKPHEDVTARQVAEKKGHTQVTCLIDQRLKEQMEAGTSAPIKRQKPFRITLGLKSG